MILVSTSAISMTMMKTIAMGLNITLKSESWNTIGMNAMTVVSTPKVIGTAMRRVPSMAASIGDSPCLRRVSTCSLVTMASSTTMPSTKMKPNNVDRLIAISADGIRANAPKKETGKPTTIQNTDSNRRKRPMQISTRIRELRAFSSSSWIRPLTIFERSFQNSIVTPSGRRPRASLM